MHRCSLSKRFLNLAMVVTLSYHLTKCSHTKFCEQQTKVRTILVLLFFHSLLPLFIIYHLLNPGSRLCPGPSRTTPEAVPVAGLEAALTAQRMLS